MDLQLSAVVVNLASAAIGAAATFAYRSYRARRATAGQAALLTGMERPTLFVFPLREDVQGATIPRTSTEDFLAINNLISAYQRAGLPAPEKVKDPTHLFPEDKRHNNLILICSSKTNKTTAEALHEIHGLGQPFSDLIPYFAQGSDGHFVIKWNKGTYPSESFGQPVEGPLDDVALIVKVRSPWAAQHKILIVAGIRGIGTWGAAEFLKKWWKPLYDRKNASRKRRTSKEGDFAALVAVRYEDYDIKTAKLIALADLDELYGLPVVKGLS